MTYLLACFAITLSSGAPKLDISAPNSNRRRAASSRSPCSGRFRFHYRHAGHPTTRSQTIQTAPETIERLTITNNRYRPKAAFPTRRKAVLGGTSWQLLMHLNELIFTSKFISICLKRNRETQIKKKQFVQSLICSAAF